MTDIATIHSQESYDEYIDDLAETIADRIADEHPDLDALTTDGIIEWVEHSPSLVFTQAELVDAYHVAETYGRCNIYAYFAEDVDPLEADLRQLTADVTERQIRKDVESRVLNMVSQGETA